MASLAVATSPSAVGFTPLAIPRPTFRAVKTNKLYLYKETHPIDKSLPKVEADVLRAARLAQAELDDNACDKQQQTAPVLIEKWDRALLGFRNNVSPSLSDFTARYIAVRSTHLGRGSAAICNLTLEFAPGHVLASCELKTGQRWEKSVELILYLGMPATMPHKGKKGKKAWAGWFVSYNRGAAAMAHLRAQVTDPAALALWNKTPYKA